MITRIPELRVPGKRLGRHLDQRTAAHREAAGPPPLAADLVSVAHTAGPGMPLNQGDTGSCTAHALAGALNSVPHWQAGAPTLAEPQTLQLYSAEEVLLGDGPYPPNDDGGTGQAVCEAAMQLGWCSAFQVASGIEEALLALVERPVITGVNWFTSFDTPPASGVVGIANGATVRGGHEIVATQIAVPAGVTASNMPDHLDEILVGLWQSWGPWGFHNSGRFFWTAATWQALLSQGGDVVVPRTARGWRAP